MYCQKFYRQGVSVKGLRKQFGAGKHVSSTGDASVVKEPAIALALKDAKVDSKPSIPLSYYMDTHNAVVQLQKAG